MQHHHSTHHHSGLRRQIRHWMRDGRYRDQRKYVIFGTATILFGFIISRLVFEIVTRDWVIIGVVVFALVVIYMIWMNSSDE